MSKADDIRKMIVDEIDRLFPDENMHPGKSTALSKALARVGKRRRLFKNAAKPKRESN